MSENFPITWENPTDAKKPWKLQTFMGQISPLEFSLYHLLISLPAAAVAELYGLPVHIPEIRRINTYFYKTTPQLSAASSNEMTMLMGKVIVRLGLTWKNEFLPEIQKQLTQWSNFDLKAVSLPTLLIHLDEALAMVQHFVELHFRITWPANLAIRNFDELYQEIFKPQDPFASHRLLQGFDNKTVEMGQALWQLSREACSLPGVLRILETYDTAEVLVSLESFAAGQTFLASINHFLEKYGMQGGSLSDSSWTEEPELIINELKNYVKKTNSVDPKKEIIKLANQRNQLITQAHKVLQNYPKTVIRRFEILLQAAQEAVTIREDHSFYIDVCCFHELRRIFKEFGRRFTLANVLNNPNDIFMLTLAELQETTLHFPGIDRRDVVRGCLQEKEKFRLIRPPEILSIQNSVSFSEYSRILNGTPGSPGQAKGPVRLLRSLEDANKVRIGDIIVCVDAAPSWTPLFLIAAAIVTEKGGMLSHCAIIAREYGIPAVIGTTEATHVLHEEQIVEVDGTMGTIKL